MELLKKLVETAGVPGREERIRQIVKDQLEAMDFEEIRTDQMGNIIAFRAGKDIEPGGVRKKVMFAAHMDEIGLVVSHIDDKGFLRFQPLGGWDPRTLMAQRVTVYGKKDLPGVIGAKPAHILTEEERKKPLEIKDYFIDLGLPKEEVVKWVEVGSPVTVHRTMEELGECLTCKTFDDRVGVYCLLEALRKVRCRLYHSRRGRIERRISRFIGNCP
ncbi:MAG: M42 family metallopeptidase [bacterium]